VDGWGPCACPSCGGDLRATLNPEESCCDEGQAQGPHPSTSSSPCPYRIGEAGLPMLFVHVHQNWGGIGACPSLPSESFRFRETNESLSHGDRHKAPTSTQPFPLSLQNLPDSVGKDHQNRGGRIADVVCTCSSELGTHHCRFLCLVGIIKNKTLHHFIPQILIKVFALENLWL